jgi:hypothetical protein
MNNKRKKIVTFFGAYHVLKAERFLKKEGIAVETIAAPRHISTDCGICIRFMPGDEERVKAVLTAAAIDSNGFYDE